jgi:elongation factor G
MVTVPEENMGDIIGDLNAKRAKILGMESQGRKATVTALVPLAEMYRYANTLKSITRGRGTFQMEFSHYEEVPREIAERIVPELRKERGVQAGDEDSR